MSSCESWGSDPDYMGSFGIDYHSLYYCSPSNLSNLVIVLMFLWIAFLMNLLAQTASNYLAPTLSKICEKMNLAYDIAGVTLLAFGNGAPDFFSLVASVTGGVDILVGVGALLGGSMFVCTVVVGTISILCPCEVSKKIFLRDISFHLFSVVSVTIIAFIQHINVYIAGSLLIAYLGYVIIVIFAPYFCGSNDNDIAGDISLTTFSTANAIQTAFWLNDNKAKKTNTSKPSSTTFNSKSLTMDVGMSHSPSTNNNNNNNNSGFTYSFLFLSNEEEEDKEKDEETGNMNHNNNKSKEKEKEQERESKKATKEDLLTINLTGGYEPCFEDIIQEDYCDVIGPSGTTSVAFTIEDNEEEEEEDEEDRVGTGGGAGDDLGLLEDSSLSASTRSAGSSLQQSLLQVGMDKGDEVNRRLYIAKGLQSRNQQRYQNILTSLYWQQWSLRRRFRHSAIAAEWQHYSILQKSLIYLESPIVLARDLTIPTLEDNAWNKLYAMCHPIMSPLFAVFVVGEMNGWVGNLPLSVFVVMLGVVPAGLLYLFATNSKAPSHYLFQMLWTLSAFVMCVMWIYLFADELITCLSAVGVILNLPPAFLGLTILAWGNSVGDYFTNTAVAKQGLGAMALAGCYGGPVFDILMSFGVALMYTTTQLYPDPFPMILDISSLVTLFFLIFTLSTTIAIVVYRGYKLDRAMGMYLIGIYVVYTICQMTLLVVNIF